MSLVNGAARRPKQENAVFGMAAMPQQRHQLHQQYTQQMMYQHPHPQHFPATVPSSAGVYSASAEEHKKQQMHLYDQQVLQQQIQQQQTQPLPHHPQQLSGPQFFCAQPGPAGHCAACNGVSNRDPCAIHPQKPASTSQYNPYF